MIDILSSASCGIKALPSSGNDNGFKIPVIGPVLPNQMVLDAPNSWKITISFDYHVVLCDVI